MFTKILVANRGEIACRVIKTAKRLGIGTVAVYSDADRDALHVRMADEAVRIGPPPSSQSYIVIDNLLEAVRQSGADAVHPGYGFLSENPAFAQALSQERVTFIGPPVRAIEAMGDKIASKKIAAEAGVSTVPGSLKVIADAEDAVAVASGIGYPVMLKASAGGGGKGMRIAWNDAEAREGFLASQREALASFGDNRIFIEKFVTQPRHIEIQVLGDQHGNLIHLGERECSIQRRNQKVIEEAPSPFVDAEMRHRMGEQAVSLAAAVGYFSAGTVEFIVDGDRHFYFLEMNTRLQVEHPVTELVTGIDLVEQMIRIAAGESLRLSQADVKFSGWAIESRVYAEDPYRNFLPSTGRLTRYRPPTEGPRADGTIVRNDTGVSEGGEISIYYDPMVAKLCAWGDTRASAIGTMSDALDDFEIEGIGHNVPFLSTLLQQPRFREGRLTTSYIADEFPTGFASRTPTDAEFRALAAVAAFIDLSVQKRAGLISGAMPNHSRLLSADRVVAVEGSELPLTITEDSGAVVVSFGERSPISVTSDWRPGMSHATFVVDGLRMGVKIATVGSGWRLRWRGSDVVMRVRNPRVAELARLMPHRPPADTSKTLLCPMPGVVTAIAVAAGDTVEPGQALATVEAMKMENVLRAERKAVIKRVVAEVGASLAVDDLIMELE